MFDPAGSTYDRRRYVEIEGAVRVNTSPARFAHSVRVARTARCYAQKLGLSLYKACLAGIGHDVAREWPARQLISYVQSYDGSISAEERKKPVLLHGRAAAILLRRQFGIMDVDILEAVEHHTLGKAGMGNLARLIFVADYLEPGRSFTDRAFRKDAKHLCLPCLVKMVIEHNQARDKDTHPFTADLYIEVRKECSCTSETCHRTPAGIYANPAGTVTYDSAKVVL